MLNFTEVFKKVYDLVIVLNVIGNYITHLLLRIIFFRNNVINKLPIF